MKILSFLLVVALVACLLNAIGEREKIIQDLRQQLDQRNGELEECQINANLAKPKDQP